MEAQQAPASRSLYDKPTQPQYKHVQGTKSVMGAYEERKVNHLSLDDTKPRIEDKHEAEYTEWMKKHQ